MTKEKTITLKLEPKLAVEVLLVLDNATQGYSKEFAPERVTRLRELMQNIDQELEKVILEE